MARINLWTFALPGLNERREDIEPNLDFELARHAEESGMSVTFNKEARQSYLRFAMAAEAVWSANFRDLGASVTRMATLAPAGRINEAIVAEEIERLRRAWMRTPLDPDADLLQNFIGAEKLQNIDLFDRAQLAAVLRVCREARSLSAAGRTLFAASRTAKTSINDADRLKKYLLRFTLSFEQLSEALKVDSQVSRLLMGQIPRAGPMSETPAIGGRSSASGEANGKPGAPFHMLFI